MQPIQYFYEFLDDYTYTLLHICLKNRDKLQISSTIGKTLNNSVENWRCQYLQVGDRRKQEQHVCSTPPSHIIAVLPHYTQQMVIGMFVFYWVTDPHQTKENIQQVCANVAALLALTLYQIQQL